MDLADTRVLLFFYMPLCGGSPVDIARCGFCPNHFLIIIQVRDVYRRKDPSDYATKLIREEKQKEITVCINMKL